MVTIANTGSLRGKITRAYIALVIGIVILGIIALLDLLFLERQVIEGEVVSNLKDAILEMRREEKNLFLYSDRGALSSADENAVRSLNILQQNRLVLTSMMQKSGLTAMIENLKHYRSQLENWKQSPTREQQPLNETIRNLGHQIHLSVESISKRERQLLKTALQESQWFLFISLFMIGLAIYIVGHQLRRVALTPLKLLESRLSSIASGELNHIDPPSHDREFVTFTNVFNKMLKELETHQKRTLQSEKLAALGILAAGVAHELNNPLSNISSSCQLLIEELDSADQKQLNIWLKQIDNETERGRNIVRSLLDFGSQRVFQREPIKLLDLINEIQTITRKTLSEYSTTLTINIPDTLVLQVDKQRIQQLLINLIQNALNAGGEKMHLHISALMYDPGVNIIPEGAEVAGNLKCLTDHDGQFIEILVTDDGPGMSKEILSKVFDPFFTTSEPGHGVGLGLFIVQEIVNEHDGCLAITSRPGKGTQIALLFPDGDKL